MALFEHVKMLNLSWMRIMVQTQNLIYFFKDIFVFINVKWDLLFAQFKLNQQSIGSLVQSQIVNRIINPIELAGFYFGNKLDFVDKLLKWKYFLTGAVLGG